MAYLHRDDQIPSPPNSLWILVTRKSQRNEFVCYSPKWQGYWTHYTPKGTVPCWHDPELCFDGCSEKTRRWYGFIHGYATKQKKVCVAQITMVAARDLRQQLAPGASLRGAVIEISRGDGPNAHVHASITRHPLKEPETLPPFIDTEPSVRAFWKIKEADAFLDRGIGILNGRAPSEWEA